MRVVVLYNNRRMLCLALYGLYALVYLAQAIISIWNLVLSLRAPWTPPEFSCGSTRLGDGENLLDALGPPAVLVFNVILFGLTLAHILPYWWSKSNRSSLMTLFLEQGTIYFAIVCAALLGEIITPMLFEHDFGLALLPLMPMASNRLFLSLRASHGSQSGFGSSLTPSSQVISGTVPTIRAGVDSEGDGSQPNVVHVEDVDSPCSPA